MNDYDLEIRLLDGAARVAGLGLNWLVQSSLLLSVGLSVGWLLRRRGPAAQSVVYRTTLVAVLVCPLATWALARTGVSRWSVALPPAWTLVGVPGASVGAGEKPAGGVPAASDSVFARAPQAYDAQAADARVGDRASAAASGPWAADAAMSRKTPVSATAVQSDLDRSSAMAGPSRQAPRLVVHFFGLIASAVCLVWLLITTVLLARLAGAWRQLARLRKSAAEAEPATVAMCREVAVLLRVAAPDVKHSPYLPGACLAGLPRPVVLLPEGTLGMTLRDLLIHELAHLRRRDCDWNLLHRLATAVFFFQPLLWKLARRLETTVEEVCDDYVVQHGSDRQAYAHRLVDIAELSSVSLAAVGVGIVSLRSLLAQRVARIIDTSRSVSIRVSSRLLTLVLLGGLVARPAWGWSASGSGRSRRRQKPPSAATMIPLRRRTSSALPRRAVRTPRTGLIRRG